MILIVGLGNPGEKYEKTRHNFGFRAIDGLSAKNNFPEFKKTTKNAASISKGIISGKEIILAKPQTFMNDSGRAVKKLISDFQTTASGLLAAHDDTDIPLGEIKISKNRGAAGHKGIESIIKALGTKNFTRIRIGAAHFERSQKQTLNEKLVLKKLTKKEEKAAEAAIKKTIEAIEFLLNENLEKAMSKYNAQEIR